MVIIVLICEDLSARDQEETNHSFQNGHGLCIRILNIDEVPSLSMIIP